MVNRMRATRAHRDNRRSHHAITAARVSKCANCGKSRLSHTVCMECGFYKGRKVIDMSPKMSKAVSTKTTAKK